MRAKSLGVGTIKKKSGEKFENQFRLSKVVRVEAAMLRKHENIMKQC